MKHNGGKWKRSYVCADERGEKTAVLNKKVYFNVMQISKSLTNQQLML